MCTLSSAIPLRCSCSPVGIVCVHRAPQTAISRCAALFTHFPSRSRQTLRPIRTYSTYVPMPIYLPHSIFINYFSSITSLMFIIVIIIIGVRSFRIHAAHDVWRAASGVCVCLCREKVCLRIGSRSTCTFTTTSIRSSRRCWSRCRWRKHVWNRDRLWHILFLCSRGSKIWR